MFFLFSLLLVSTLLQCTSAVYNLAQDYSGDSFFDGWDFFTDTDPTGGHVLYQSQADAANKGLISVQKSKLGNATDQVFMGVDSTNISPNGRASVRISTQKTFQHALVLADIAHQPGGTCGVWPAFWMLGTDWPSNGEIDIVEGVSTQPANQMTLHTSTGPLLNDKVDFSGKLLTPNCDVNAVDQPKNAGCAIADDSNITFGTNFNAIGGGVFATEWTSQFIKIWFFPRNAVPADVQTGNPVPSESWGTPNSVFQGSFNMDDHFNNLQLVFNTAFCGAWAGEVWSSMPECAALAPTCDEYVTNNPKAFDQAFWLVNSVKVFQDDGRVPAPNSTTPSQGPLPSATPVLASPTATLDPSVPSKRPPHPPQPPTNVTGDPHFPGGIPKSHDGQHVHPPDMMFGSPNTNGKHRRRRHGGAVIFMKS